MNKKIYIIFDIILSVIAILLLVFVCIPLGKNIMN